MSHNNVTDEAVVARRQKKLEQVKKLLDKANSTVYDEEAATYREQAEKLMVAYRISETDIVEGGRPRLEPTDRFFIVIAAQGSLVKQYTIDLFAACVQFTHCQAAYRGIGGDGQCNATVVGYPEDLEYLDLLFTSISLQFSQELDPHPEQDLTRGENIYRMKAAGLTWEMIFKRLNIPFMDAAGNKTRFHSQLMREYKEFCETNNLKPITAQPKTWVRNFADGYVRRVTTRFHDILINQSIASWNEDERATSEKYALVLRSRDAMVKDKFQERFPKLGTVRNAGGRAGKLLSEAMAQGDYAGSKADIGAGGSVRGGSGGRKELGS